jgi:predicted amidophosphoribosyltransferase
MHPGYCPNCRQRVTPFAAGCALCGADLDPHRWQKPLTVGQRLVLRVPGRVRRVLTGADQMAAATRKR